jgi:hypothetical protein
MTTSIWSDIYAAIATNNVTIVAADKNKVVSR